MSRCHFIPPYLLAKVAASHTDVEIARCGHATLAIDEALRSRRGTPPPVVETVTGQRLRARAAPQSGEDAWTIYTADHGSALPGRPVREAGEPASEDLAVDEAYAGVQASLDLFRAVYDRDSFDGRGAPVVATVHYERSYDNAFWDGRQLVFGDGDGKVFARFTDPIDVCAHEFAHAVTQYTAGLVYAGQSGALNESVSDCFASCVKQRVLGQRADEADWLIGEGIFTAAVDGRALRSMAAPGTAYDDETLGKDPQIAHMEAYLQTKDDNGGVHLNSGIPNRAFYLAAIGIGGFSWEGAGRIWYAALSSGEVSGEADFAGFAAATVAAARRAEVGAGPDAARIVAEAWAQVGVRVPELAGAGTTAAAGSAGDGPAVGAGDAGDAVVVQRSGGFAGLQRRGEVVLGDDPRTPEIERLLSRIDVAAVMSVPAEPDRFTYAFWLRGEQVVVAEQALTPELSRLASLVLDD